MTLEQEKKLRPLRDGVLALNCSIIAYENCYIAGDTVKSLEELENIDTYIAKILRIKKQLVKELGKPKEN